MKRFIKILLIGLLSLLMMGFTSYDGVNEGVNEGASDPVYRDLGSYHINYADGSVIHVDAYITKKYNYNKSFGSYTYVYELTLRSKSIHNGYYTQTWLYGSRIFYNGNELTYNQYPYGMTLYIGTAPTVIYSWYTNEEEIAKFTVSWINAAYEPRIR